MLSQQRTTSKRDVPSNSHPMKFGGVSTCKPLVYPAQNTRKNTVRRSIRRSLSNPMNDSFNLSLIGYSYVTLHWSGRNLQSIVGPKSEQRCRQWIVPPTRSRHWQSNRLMKSFNSKDLGSEGAGKFVSEQKILITRGRKCGGRFIHSSNKKNPYIELGSSNELVAI